MEEEEEEEQYRNREGGSWTSVPLSIPHCLPKTSNRRWMALRRSASGSECTEPISLVTKEEEAKKLCTVKKLPSAINTVPRYQESAQLITTTRHLGNVSPWMALAVHAGDKLFFSFYSS